MAQGGEGAEPGGDRPFGLDEGFSLAFQAVRRGFGGFVLLFLISFILFAVLGAVLVGGRAILTAPVGAPEAVIGNPGFWLLFVLAVVAYVLLIVPIHLTTLGLAYAVLRHRRLPLRRLFALARRRFRPALGAYIVTSLAIMGGTILFVVPGVILGIRWYVWAPVCLIEGRGVSDLLRRSVELTHGRRWTIFWLWLITLIVSGALTRLADALAMVHAGFGLVSLLVYGFASVFSSCLMVAVYVGLRDREKGPVAADLVGAET